MIRTLAAAGLAAVALTTGTAATANAPTPPHRAAWMRTACVTEDSVNCAWNASEQGNGVGHSFYTVRRGLVNAHGRHVGRVVCVYYVKRDAARRWDACHLLPAGQDGSL